MMTLEWDKWPGTRGCGTDITCTGDGEMLDGEGHAVDIVHERWLRQAVHAFSTVNALHRCDPEGIVPRCTECRSTWPCATADAMGFLR